MRLLVLVSVAAAAQLGAAASAHATPSVLTFDDVTHSAYQLDSDGEDANTMTLSVASNGRVVVTDSAGITDATAPDSRCVSTIVPNQLSCAPGGTQDDVSSWTFRPAGGDNSLSVVRAAATATPTVRAIDAVRFTSGAGCDDVAGHEVTGVAIGFIVDPGAAPDGCTQDITTPGTDGVHSITLQPSPGRNVVAGGAGTRDQLILGDFPDPGVQVSEDGVANDGEKADPDDSYGRGLDVYVLSAFGDRFAGDGTVNAGAGNDTMSAGAGDDVLNGGTGDDDLDGGFGDDRLDPGDGADIVRAGPGDDLLVDTRGPDVLDGGEGSLDAIAYGAYLPDGPLSLTLDGAANDGRTGEGDNLLGIEVLTGGPKDDVITGDATENYLNGGDGADRIDGGGAIDVLRGNAGDDTLTGRDGTLIRDDVGCNDGSGDTAIVDANDLAASDCETVDRAAPPPGVDPSTLSPAGIGGLTPAPTPGPVAGAGDRAAPIVAVGGLPARVTRSVLLRRGVTVALSADETASYEVRLLGRTTKATLSAVRDLTLAQRALGLGAGVRKVQLKPKSRLLGRKSKLNLRVVVVATDAAGNERTVTRRLRVAPRR